MFLSGMLAWGRSAVKQSPGPRGGTWVRWLPAISLMAGIFYLSHQSTPLGETSNGALPIVAHLGLFATLAVFISFGLTGSAGRPCRAPLWLVAVLAFSLTVLYGVTDEVHQAFVAGRVASEADLALDATGALLAVAAYAAFLRLLRSGRPFP